MLLIRKRDAYLKLIKDHVIQVISCTWKWGSVYIKHTLIWQMLCQVQQASIGAFHEWLPFIFSNTFHLHPLILSASLSPQFCIKTCILVLPSAHKLNVLLRR